MVVEVAHMKILEIDSIEFERERTGALGDYSRCHASTDRACGDTHIEVDKEVRRFEFKVRWVVFGEGGVVKAGRYASALNAPKSKPLATAIPCSCSLVGLSHKVLPLPVDSVFMSLEARSVA
jgi:hypothetical protein